MPELAGGDEVLCADAWARTGALWIADRAEEAIADRGRFLVGLAGGSTPRVLYQALAELRLPWDDFEFYFGDERCVEPTHPDSNYAMAKAALFDELPQARVFRIEAERGEPAAGDYAAILPQRLDLMILGMGEDGHTASLFPGATWPPGRRTALVESPKPPPWRITVLPPVIEAARKRLVVVTGAAKARLVAQVLGGDASLPVAIATPATWLLDPAAASLLEGVIDV